MSVRRSGTGHTLTLKPFVQLFLSLVAHLNHYAGVFGKEIAHDIGRSQFMQIDMQTAMTISEGQLKERGDESAGRDIVPSQEPTAMNEFLHSTESIDEVFGTLHRGHIVAHAAQALGEGTSTEALLVEGEVDII